MFGFFFFSLSLSLMFFRFLRQGVTSVNMAGLAFAAFSLVSLKRATLMLSLSGARMPSYLAQCEKTTDIAVISLLTAMLFTVSF